MIRTTLGAVLLLLLGGVRATESGAPVSAGPAVLVHDFFPGASEGVHPPAQLTRLGQTLFFIGDDRESGPNLWRSDGTPGGSSLVAVPGLSGPLNDPEILGVFGDRLLWSAYSPEESPRRLLLAADEAGKGTVLATYESPYSFDEKPAIVGSRYYFLSCFSTVCGFWSSDGTAAGTGPVATLSGFTGTDQNLLATFADRWLVFSTGGAVYAYDVADDRTLTLLPKTAADRAYAVGANLYLPDEDHLWVSRLDAPEASLLFQGRHPFVTGWRGHTLYFIPADGKLRSTDGVSVQPYAGDRLENFETLAGQLGAIRSQTLIALPGYYSAGLYAADETTREVHQIHHICTGLQSCNGTSFSPITVAGEQAYLTIQRELWRSDGTASGTRPHPVLRFADPGGFRVFDDRLVLGATSRTGDAQLWSTDGSVAGTEALSGGGARLPFQVQGAPERLGDALYVWASRKPLGQQLWRVTEGHAAAVTAQRHLPAGLAPGRAFRAGRNWVLQGREFQGWIGLSAAGKVENLPLSPDVCNGSTEPCATAGFGLGERFLFAEGYTELLAVTDGTAAGTRALPLQDPDGFNSAVAALGRFRDRALVLGEKGGLWIADGTPGGSRFVTQLPVVSDADSSGLPVGPPVAVGPLSFLFRRVPVPGDESLAALELWRTDGTAAGTLRLASIPFDRQASPYPDPRALAGRLFFRAFGVLWMSDGSPAGTRPVPRQLPGGTFALIAGKTALYAGAGYLTPKQPLTLWAIDPMTLRETRLGSFSWIFPGTPGDSLGSVVDNTLVFYAWDLAGNGAWRRTEGTPASTVPLPETLATHSEFGFFAAGDRRYFPACDTEHGCELWSTDRLGEDTRLVQDVWLGPRGSDPEILGSDEHSLWFTATEPTVGNELWRLELSAVGEASPAAVVRPASRLVSRPSAREREIQAKRALEPRWRRMLR